MPKPIDPKKTVPPKPPAHDTAASAAEHTRGFAPAREPDKDYSFLEKPRAKGELGRLAHYRVLKELGRGGMGCVLLAEDTKLRRQVALKVMLPRFAQDAGAKQRFLHEARAAAKIKHDNVVTIFQVDEVGAAPFIALEYLRGTPLDKYLKDNGALPVSAAIRIARDMAEGLSAAHQQGLIHRDVKPANVWLEAPKGRVKLLDFGLARADHDDTHLTQSGAILGTPAFMAPEQARGEKVDGRSDLFSLGVVLYRMITGKQPFNGPSTAAVLTAIAIDTPAPVRSLNPQVPESLERIIMKLLAKAPSQRHASAQQVIADLKGVLKEIAHGKATPTETYVPVAPKRSVKRPPSRWPIIVVAASLGLVAVGLLAWQTVIRLPRNEEPAQKEVDQPLAKLKTNTGEPGPKEDDQPPAKLKLPIEEKKQTTSVPPDPLPPVVPSVPKYSIKQVMQDVMRQPVSNKMGDGTASREEREMVLEYVLSLPEIIPPKGNLNEWKTRSNAVIDAARSGNPAAWKAAVNCKDCHSAHK